MYQVYAMLVCTINYLFSIMFIYTLYFHFHHHTPPKYTMHVNM